MPDNSFFYYAAYVAAGVIYAAYCLSIVTRWRSVQQRGGAES